MSALWPLAARAQQAAKIVAAPPSSVITPANVCTGPNRVELIERGLPRDPDQPAFKIRWP